MTNYNLDCLLEYTLMSSVLQGLCLLPHPSLAIFTPALKVGVFLSWEGDEQGSLNGPERPLCSLSGPCEEWGGGSGSPGPGEAFFFIDGGNAAGGGLGPL